MRLSCPNCAAQYEVPPEAIPPEGREVQCSACATTWFEQPAESRPQLVEPDPLAAAPRVEDDAEEADDLAEIAVVPPVMATPGIGGGAEAPPLPPRSRVPPEVERILREEAEREAEARAAEAARRAPGPDDAEAGPPDIGRPARRVRRDEATAAVSTDPGAPVAVIPAAAAPVAVLAPAPAPAPTPAAPALRMGRVVDREVDIDRINSTLRSQADLIGQKAPQVAGGTVRRRRRGGGFLGGFWGTVAILAVLTALYAWRPRIVEYVPQAAAILDPYAHAVDEGRFWLDREIGRLLGATSVGL